MSSIKHIDHKDKSILYIDLEGCASDFEVIDLGEKAKKLIKLASRRSDILVLYNLRGMVLTKQILLHMKNLMEHASLVSRRVIFGTEPKYSALLRQIIVSLHIEGKTRFVENYAQALNLLVEDAEWVERRHASVPPAQERRMDPMKVNEADIIEKVSKLI